MAPETFHHVGVAVRDLGRAVESLRQLFPNAAITPVVDDPNQGVRIQFLRLGDLRVELLEPLANPSPVDAILKRGIGLYHVCFEIDDLEECLTQWVEAGATLLSPAKPARAFDNRRVAFVMCQGLMIELLEAE
jgi:methylmalonyl-CoA/ethylmalonyl-CoA epimerase